MSVFDTRWRRLAARATPSEPAPVATPDGADLLARASARRQPVYALAWWAIPLAAAAIALAVGVLSSAPEPQVRPTFTLGGGRGLLEAWPNTSLIPQISMERP